MYKSPFLIFQDFLSPQVCEEIRDTVRLPLIVEDPVSGNIEPELYLKNESSEEYVYQKIMDEIPQITKYFNFEYKGMESMSIEWLPTGSERALSCESSEYLGNKWVKTKHRDFCCVIFLSEYNDKNPFDIDFECWGGKMEFPNHNFGFNPQQGTMIVYPSDPRFVNNNLKIMAGELFQIRAHITATIPYLYDPKKFPGDYRTWFNDFV